MAFFSSIYSLLVFLLFVGATASFAGDDFTYVVPFYSHERSLGATDATVVESVNLYQDSLIGFGNIIVLDNPLRVSADPNSTLIGRFQGIVVFADMSINSTLSAGNLVFNGGEHNGSTLAFFGVFQTRTGSVRSIVGGTGRFGMATGYLVNEPIVYTSPTTLYSLWTAYVKIPSK